jgi:hypothetical protein
MGNPVMPFTCYMSDFCVHNASSVPLHWGQHLKHLISFKVALHCATFTWRLMRPTAEIGVRAELSPNHIVLASFRYRTTLYVKLVKQSV